MDYQNQILINHHSNFYRSFYQCNEEDYSETTNHSSKNSSTELSSITINKNGSLIHCITIIGQIEGHYVLPEQNKTTKYEHIIPQLVAIEECNEIDGLLLILNTVGGDIEAGLAIAELISGMKTPTVSLVLGGGHSIGVPLAVAAQESFIVPSATMTIHPVRMNGLFLGVPQTYAYFEKMQDRIVEFVCKHSSITENEFKKFMLAKDELATDVGTVLDGNQAVSSGLIHHLGTLSDALLQLEKMIQNKSEINHSGGNIHGRRKE